MKRIVLSVMAALALAGGVFALHTEPVKAVNAFDTIENGVFIGDVDVAGMTSEEAAEAVESYVSGLGSKTITLNALNDNKVSVSLSDLGLYWENQDVVSEAAELGKSGNIVQRYKALKDLEHENHVYPVETGYKEEKIRKVIEDRCLQYNVEPVDGTLTREDDEFIYTPGQTGVKIDVDASVTAVMDALSSEDPSEGITVELAAETAEPRGSEEQLTAVKDVLGTFTTSFSTSSGNRSGNLANGASKINGTLLYPGDSFSLYETVSPFTVDNGYFLAGAYSGGLVIDSLGGGICQVSTTLYNAALRAELEITQRSCHSMIVGYVEPSEDAAISGTEKDMCFVNNQDYPIYIEGFTTPDKHITFTIYGKETRPSNRKVSFESKVLSRTEPKGERVVADGGQRAGYVSVQAAHVGYTAELWKVVTVDGKETERTKVNESQYNAVPRTAAVGTATSNPAAAGAISAAIASGSIDQCRATAAAINAGTYNDPNQVAAMEAQAAQDAALAAQQAAIAAQQAAIEQQQQQAAAAAAAAAGAQ